MPFIAIVAPVSFKFECETIFEDAYERSVDAFVAVGRCRIAQSHAALTRPISGGLSMNQRLLRRSCTGCRPRLMAEMVFKCSPISPAIRLGAFSRCSRNRLSTSPSAMSRSRSMRPAAAPVVPASEPEQ